MGGWNRESEEIKLRFVQKKTKMVQFGSRKIIEESQEKRIAGEIVFIIFLGLEIFFQ